MVVDMCVRISAVEDCFHQRWKRFTSYVRSCVRALVCACARVCARACEPDITQWEVKAKLRDIKNGITSGNDHIHIETLKAQDTYW